jgi:hypothetical protein
MTHEYLPAPGFEKHAGAHLAGESALFFPENILRPQLERASAERTPNRIEGSEWRCEDDLDVSQRFDRHAFDGTDQRLSL